MKIIRKFLSLEKNDQVIFFLLVTTVLNTIMAFIKFAFSITLPSLWFGINATFNIILVLLRIFSIRDYRRMRLEINIQRKREIGFQNYVNNGILLILLGISYFMVSVYMYYKGTNTTMHEYLTYLIALIAFYSIGSAIYGMAKYKRNHNPVLSSVKITNFANALTSIVLTQVVLLDTFNNGIDVRMANGFMGMGISIIIICLGLYMIISTQKCMESDL